MYDWNAALYTQYQAIRVAQEIYTFLVFLLNLSVFDSEIQVPLIPLSGI